MPKFIFAYHGGKKPETEEAGKAAMDAWMSWMGANQESFVDAGAPVGRSSTVSASGVEDNGGANPVSGYSLVAAADLKAALELAKGCPMVVDGSGTVEVAPIVEM